MPASIYITGRRADNPHQVMPYAAGPQTVAIPYYQLKDDLNSDSPLADFWQLTNR